MKYYIRKGTFNERTSILRESGIDINSLYRGVNTLLMRNRELESVVAGMKRDYDVKDSEEFKELIKKNKMLESYYVSEKKDKETLEYRLNNLTDMNEVNVSVINRLKDKVKFFENTESEEENNVTMKNLLDELDKKETKIKGLVLDNKNLKQRMNNISGIIRKSGVQK